MIRLLLVDARRSSRDVMLAVLRDEVDMQMAAYAHSGPEALARLGDCNVVVMSASLPVDDVSWLVSEMCRLRPGIKVFTMDVPDAITGDSAYVQAGAAGYILEEEPMSELLRKVRLAAKGSEPERPWRGERT